MRTNNLIIKSVCPNISDKQLDQLYMYYAILKEESSKMNLTSITEIEEVYIKHFYDSILLAKTIEISNKTLVDVGTGAGFPGLVLKIIEPSLKLTLIEPTTKRCNFLNKVISKLNLDDVVVINDRAEKAIVNFRESFDIATARAVANLQILLELLVPFVKVGGYVVPMKGSNIQEEIEQAKNAINKLKTKIVEVKQYMLPKDLGERNIVILNKKEKTLDIYPREYAKIKKKPL